MDTGSNDGDGGTEHVWRPGKPSYLGPRFSAMINYSDTEETRDRLRQLARERRISRSELLRGIVAEGLDAAEAAWRDSQQGTPTGV